MSEDFVAKALRNISCIIGNDLNFLYREIKMAKIKYEWNRHKTFNTYMISKCKRYMLLAWWWYIVTDMMVMP